MNGWGRNKEEVKKGREDGSQMEGWGLRLLQLAQWQVECSLL
jgi:hypothetical protein